MKVSTRRWLVALGALLAGGAVSCTLFLVASAGRHSIEVYAAAADISAGSTLSIDVVQLRSIDVDDDAQLFKPKDQATLIALRATHDLIAGQLIQRADVAESSPRDDRRLVFVAIKNVPPSSPGSRVDLLVIRSGPDRTSVSPFAVGVVVEASVAGGLVLAVPSRQAAAFIYAAATMELVAVIAEPGAASGGEVPVSSSDEAFAVASQ